MVSTSSPRLSVETLRRLDRYAMEVLTCPPELARSGGVHVRAEPLRAGPTWRGFTIPLVALAFAEGAVVAVRPDLEQPLRLAMGSDLRLPHLDAAALRRLRRTAERLAPHSFVLLGFARAVDARSFHAHPTRLAELIPVEDPAALHLRHRFDGAIFGVRGPRGRLISWAALKLKSDDVWEVAVTTEPDYRGRGHARDVVSAATQHALEHERIALYVHDHENTTSGFVARSLGYRVYAEIVLAEY